MNTALTYRPKGNLVWGSVALLLDALFLLQAVCYPAKGENLLIDLPVSLSIAVLAWLVWLRPKLVLHAENLVVVNPIGTRAIAYRDIEALDTKWTLKISHGSQQTRVWVAPANGKYRWIAESNSRVFFSKLPRTEGKLAEVTSMSQSRNSDSGVAASLIRDRIEDLHLTRP